MPSKLKEIYYTPESVRGLVEALAAAYPPFDRDRFLAELYADPWPRLELMSRMRHLTQVLHAVLPAAYPQALAILQAIAPGIHGMEAMSLQDYVATYGLDHWELSMPALAFFTPLASGEFAVRAFIQRDAPRAFAYLYDWAHSDNHHVRRLASEGCRPTLPWGRDLPALQADPSPILPILEALRDDPEVHVRKSVANNLNAISKDHPDLVLDLAERWRGVSPRTDWILKHGCRTLLKAGNQRALRLFGVAEDRCVVDRLRVEPSSLPIGGRVHYSLELHVPGDAPCPVRLELRVDYARGGGRTARKVFHIAERAFPPGDQVISRTLSFADRSTRKHFPGIHRLTLIANGREVASATAELLPSNKQPSAIDGAAEG